MPQVKVIQPLSEQSKKLRVAAYARVSSDSADQLNSFATQVDYYTGYIQSKEEWEFAGLYADEAISGITADKRSDFQRLLADCHAGKIDRILVKSISRFARNIQENCDLKTSDNLILYGHHMLDGGMFSDLDLYKKKSFWEKHKTIRFDTLDEIAEYEILAVIVTTAYRPDSFRYYEYTGGSQEQFEKYVSDCKRLSLYDTGVNAEYGDKLITLSTCEYSQNDGRLLVVAKKTED